MMNLDVYNLTKVLNDATMYHDLVDARTQQFQSYASNLAITLINSSKWNEDQRSIADLLLRISNLMYNNTTDEVLPLDDGLYDQLLEKFKIYDGNFQVGAPPIIYEEAPTNEVIDQKVMCTVVTKEEAKNKLYIDDIHRQNLPMSMGFRPVNMCSIVRDPISKRLINTKHKYPELVGTLDKCKFVLNNDAALAGVLDKDDTVKVFERDFIHKCLAMGIIRPDEKFAMVGELKYDGISVEASVRGDTIISALSRGDTADNVATDLTPILGGYRFPFAKDIPSNLEFGIKFEAVMLKRDMERLGNLRGKSYKNCRNAIIGLFGSSDAYRFVDYITLIPLATSLDMPREDELKFLNHYYNSGQYNRYVLFYGTYVEILYQVKQFTESAEIIRKILPYMIDGVVISFTDPNKINMLGRTNSVNKYSMAIKFNPKKVRTIFTGYTFNIGKTGEVIPMVHFKPCEFIGAIHTKQTLHSYQRFKELNLIKGQQIDIEYRNDVITYVTKPDNEFNRHITGKPEKFIDECPFCGSTIAISNSGKSAFCPNPFCPERAVSRMTYMLKIFDFTDFSEETIKVLGIKSFEELINLSEFEVGILGPTDSVKFMQHIYRLRQDPVLDYKVMSALGMEGLADEKWKKIFEELTIKELYELGDVELYDRLVSIKFIGAAIANTIIDRRLIYKTDLESMIKHLHIIDSKGATKLPKVSFTGFRDAEFAALLYQYGFDAGDYGVTKDTVAVIADDPNSSSTKITKARSKGIPIYSKSEFIAKNNIKI